MSVGIDVRFLVSASLVSCECNYVRMRGVGNVNGFVLECSLCKWISYCESIRKSFGQDTLHKPPTFILPSPLFSQVFNTFVPFQIVLFSATLTLTLHKRFVEAFNRKH